MSEELKACDTTLPLPARRCLLLADLLETVPDVDSDRAGDHIGDGYYHRSWGRQDECGTVACALGWGGLKLAPELGFTYNPNDPVGKFRDLDGQPYFSPYAAAREAFDMTQDDAEATFANNAGSSTTGLESVMDREGAMRNLRQHAQNLVDKQD